MYVGKGKSRWLRLTCFLNTSLSLKIKEDGTNKEAERDLTGKIGGKREIVPLKLSIESDSRRQWPMMLMAKKGFRNHLVTLGSSLEAQTAHACHEKRLKGEWEKCLKTSILIALRFFVLCKMKLLLTLLTDFSMVLTSPKFLFCFPMWALNAELTSFPCTQSQRWIHGFNDHWGWLGRLWTDHRKLIHSPIKTAWDV